MHSYLTQNTSILTPALLEQLDKSSTMQAAFSQLVSSLSNCFPSIHGKLTNSTSLQIILCLKQAHLLNPLISQYLFWFQIFLKAFHHSQIKWSNHFHIANSHSSQIKRTRRNFLRTQVYQTLAVNWQCKQSIHITKCEKFLCVCVYYQTPLPFLARFGSNFEQSYE